MQKRRSVSGKRRPPSGSNAWSNSATSQLREMVPPSNTGPRVRRPSGELSHVARYRPFAPHRHPNDPNDQSTDARAGESTALSPARDQQAAPTTGNEVPTRVLRTATPRHPQLPRQLPQPHHSRARKSKRIHARVGVSKLGRSSEYRRPRPFTHAQIQTFEWMRKSGG